MRGQKGHCRDEVIKKKGLHRFREVGLLDRSDFGEKGLLERWGLLVRWGFGGLEFYKRKDIREKGYEREGDWERWDYLERTGLLKEGLLALYKLRVIREKEIERRGIIGQKKLWRIVVFRKKELWRNESIREELNKTSLKQN